MNRRDKKERLTELATRVVELYTRNKDITQAEVAEQLRVSQSFVSKTLREHGYGVRKVEPLVWLAEDPMTTNAKCLLSAQAKARTGKALQDLRAALNMLQDLYDRGLITDEKGGTND